MPNQSFLPVLDTRTKVLRGMVGIAPTEFDGTEEDFDIGGSLFPIQKYEPVVGQSWGTRRPWYMAITLPYLEMRQEAYRGIPGYIPVEDVLPGSQWQATGAVEFKRESFGALIDGLVYGFGSNVTVSAPPTPTVNDSLAAFSWVASIPFANQPQVTFFDINWVEAVQLQNPNPGPVYLVIDSVTTGAPAAQDKLRAIVVVTGQPAINRATYNTIRVIRMPGQTVVAGETYIINATVRGANNYSAAVQIDLTIA